MGFSMGFNKLNKVMAVATVLATVSCLVPESAQALNLVPESAQALVANINDIQFKFSGTPNSEDKLDIFFNLETELDTSNLIFEKGIQKATYICAEYSTENCSLDEKFIFSSGDLEAYQIAFIDREPYVQYVAMLTGINYFTEEDAFLHIAIQIPSSSPNLSIKAIEDLSEFLLFNKNQEVGVFARLNERLDFDFLKDNASQFLQFSVTQVPEPNVTSSLLSAGAIGTVLLLKHIGRP